MNQLGNEVEAAIIQQGFLQQEVAEKVGISPQYLGDIMRNRRTPSDKVLDKIVAVLGISRNYAYYLVNRYPPEYHGLELNLNNLNKALDWLKNPSNYSLRKIK